MYFETFQQFTKQLGQVNAWFDAAEAHATSKKFDPSLYLGFRLAPDQFPLARQVQVTCDTAKLAAARLTGKDAPSHPDTETTLGELRARLGSVTGYLGGLGPSDFAGAASRVVSQPRWEGKVMSGADYFREHAVPNFYFHLSHTYALLRHSGVPLGKRDFLGALSLTTP